MYSKFMGVIEGETQLKKYHHVKLDQEFKLDCSMWKSFLDQSMAQTVAIPFLDFGKVWILEELRFYNDASKNLNLGFGCIFKNFYTFSRWEKGFIQEKNPSIEYLELYALCIGVFTWAEHLQNLHFAIYCDNQAVQSMVNSTTAGGKNCMALIRLLVLKSIQYNFRIKVFYVKSKDNDLADALSRLDFDKFEPLRHKAGIHKFPCKLPEEIYPPSRIWID